MARKGDIKIKKGVSYEAQLSTDKRTFVIRIESEKPISWYDALLHANFWSKDEIGKLIDGGAPNPREH